MVATTTELSTSHRAPSNPPGHWQWNLLFPSRSTPSRHLPPFLQGLEVQRRGKHTNFRQTSRHHSEATQGLNLHTGVELQPSLTPKTKTDTSIVDAILCFYCIFLLKNNTSWWLRIWQTKSSLYAMQNFKLDLNLLLNLCVAPPVHQKKCSKGGQRKKKGKKK